MRAVNGKCTVPGAGIQGPAPDSLHSMRLEAAKSQAKLERFSNLHALFNAVPGSGCYPPIDQRKGRIPARVGNRLLARKMLQIFISTEACFRGYYGHP
jgi:hypothetical protein